MSTCSNKHKHYVHCTHGSQMIELTLVGSGDAREALMRRCERDPTMLAIRWSVWYSCTSSNHDREERLWSGDRGGDSDNVSLTCQFVPASVCRLQTDRCHGYSS